MKSPYLLLIISIILFSCRHKEVIVQSVPEIISESAGSTEVARIEHQAILLDDGRVFVSGGASDGYSHETYQISAGSWTSLDSSIYSHETHGLAQLPDGKILAIGGFQKQPINPNGSGGGKAMDGKNDIYDPVTQTWETAASLLTGRAGFSTSVLPDGKILVAGGFYLDKSTGSRGHTRLSATTEIYDPNTKVWTAGPSMHQPRVLHHALTLADERILVLGGDNQALSGEIYDPRTNTWSMISALDSGYYRSFAAIMLDHNRVLVTGGNQSGWQAINNCYIYNLSSDSWREIPPLHIPRFDHTLSLLPDGKVLALGGSGPLDDPPFYPTPTILGSGEVFDPVTEKWELREGLLIYQRTRHITVPIRNNEFLIVGGTGAEIIRIK